MKNKEVIKEIIFLAKSANNGENSSFYSLLKDKGYFESHNQISESDISNALVEYPESIDNWLAFSENKRVSSGWFFKKSAEKYTVGYFPADTGIFPKEYSDPADACAAFIKGEIEEY